MDMTVSYAINGVLFNSLQRQRSTVDLLSCGLMFVWHINDLSWLCSYGFIKEKVDRISAVHKKTNWQVPL